MAVTENKSVYGLIQDNVYTISAGATIDTQSFDTRDYQRGVTIFILGLTFSSPTDSISFVKIQNRAEPTDNWEDLDPLQYVPQDLTPVQNLTQSSFGSLIAIPSLGFFGTKRYVRAQFQGGANSGDATVLLGYQVGFTLAPENS